MKVKLLGRVRPSVTPWTAAYQAPLSMGFSRQEYWSVVPVPSPRADSRSLKTVLKASLSLNYFVVSLNKAPIVKNSNEPVTFVIRQPLVLTRSWKMTTPSPPKKKKNDPEEWRSEENLRLSLPAMSEEPPQTGTDQVTVQLQGQVLLTSESGPDACFLLFFCFQENNLLKIDRS